MESFLLTCLFTFVVFFSDSENRLLVYNGSIFLDSSDWEAFMNNRFNLLFITLLLD